MRTFRFLLFFTAATTAFAQDPIPLDLDTEAKRAVAVNRLLNQSLTLKAQAEAIAILNGWPISGETQDGVYELIRIEDGKPVYHITHNANAAISTAANLVRNASPYNANGTGVVVGIWDGGDVRTTHQELSGRVTLFNSVGIDDHATHVAGTIGATGIDSAAQGMAPAAMIDSYYFSNVVAEMTGRAATYPGEPGKILLSNNSWGLVTGWQFGNWSGSVGWHWWGTFGEREDRDFGRYIGQWDPIIAAAPYYLPIKSAGNDRNDGPPTESETFYYFNGGWQSKAYDSAVDPFPDGFDNGGYDSISNHGIDKNVLTVGATLDAVSGGVRVPALGAITSFSGWGPTDDGRIKPDVVANGNSLYSSGGGSNMAYNFKSGTSMSAPNTTGSAALLVDYYDNVFPGQAMRASTLKGLIIHTADDLGNAGPDYVYGWGLVDTQAAADHILSHSQTPSARRITEATLNNGLSSSIFFSWDGVSPIRATICWTDPPAAAGSGLDNPALKLINDLDIRVYGPGGSPTYSPFILNPSNPSASATTGDNFRDNVEQVLIASPGAPGLYELRVTHKSSLSGGSQVYSLFLDGSAAALELSPLTGLSTGGTQGAVSGVSQGYTLTNSSGSSVGWTIAKSADWVTLSTMSGTIGPGGNAFVTVAIDATRASQFAPGTYADSVVITNTNTSQTMELGMNLMVAPIEETAVEVYAYPMNASPGWTTQGAWAFGPPQGLGSFGGDPGAARTGTNVYGYNLAGNYTNNLPEQYLTTTALDFSDMSNVTLKFWRWLAIEHSNFDHASVRVSNNGSSWTTVWEHVGGSFNDSAWIEQTIDISSVADGQSTVYVRWVMGATDSAVVYPGWNIDDVSFTADAGSAVNLQEAWVDFAFAGTPQLGTQSEPFNALLLGMSALIDDGSGVLRIKGNTAQNSTPVTGALVKPMTIESVGGTVRIGAP